MDKIRRLALCFALLVSLTLTACVASGPKYRAVCENPPNLADKRVVVLAKRESLFFSARTDAVAQYLKEALIQSFPGVIIIASVPCERSGADMLLSFSERIERPPDSGITTWERTRYYWVHLELIEAGTNQTKAVGVGQAVYDGGDGVYGPVCRSVECALRFAVYEATASLCGGPRRIVPIAASELRNFYDEGDYVWVIVSIEEPPRT